MTVNWPRLTEILRSHDRFLLTSHIRPDCDALGSELGLAGILDAMGKRVTIVNNDATPPNLRFIDPAARIQVLGRETSGGEPPPHDVLVVLDTCAWAQLGGMGEVIRDSSAQKIVIDHHVSGDDLGAELFKDPEAEATGALITKLADHLGVALTAEMATPLFAAIATDTGWFRFGSARGPTYRMAARLVDVGASPADIYGQLYEQQTLARVRLRGAILARVVCELEGRLAHTHALRDDFARAGALPGDTEEVINMTLAIAGVEFAVILVEQPGGGFKVSFRGRGDLDCSRVAEQFGGGGHKAAAGAFVEGRLEEAQPKVLDLVREAMR